MLENIFTSLVGIAFALAAAVTVWALCPRPLPESQRPRTGQYDSRTPCQIIDESKAHFLTVKERIGQ